uniref:Uncharacterized protein n=1 Tax=Candidatus Kentrum sp. TUN TaxID=2126343 RepID=A0A451ATW1_9GAMM|nr:MAG: hypothetical protein BECKTUN1418F_GA0071002_11993 [Candidatus Kentron sp. TUN]VFK69489.1 MAG: hypothetical protein BECKTUN1418E_GA0071001_11964 [Candidatus Kentron sp. TUN]
MNPFEIRATDYMDNDSSFLRLVTPEPLHALFEPKADNLLRPLVRVFGTPGSGKTTLAHLVSFRRMVLVVRQYHEVSVFEPLMSALMACRFAVENAPLIVATRVPCETIYRDFHELPYGDDLKFRLMWSLIQARAMLGWINEMLGAGISLDDIRFEPREGAEVLMEEIVGTSPEEIRTRAREAERAIHEVATALLPMGESELCLQVQRRYDPLSALGNIVVTNRDEEEWRLRPLLILDDVHGLHPEQRNRLEQELKRRETGIGRWMMMRLDALGPETVLGQGSDDLEHPNAGTQKNRDYYDIHFQELTRGKQAKKFVARMLTKMADNYLKRWDIFNTRQVASFSQLLDEVPKELTPNMLDKLECRVNATQEKLGISATEREKIKQEVADFFEKRNDDEAGLCLMSESILIHRYANRRGANQLSLFDDPQDIQVPKMNLRIIHAARLELGRRYKRPYYFGMDTLIAASSHHPETFLQLAGHLAQYAQTRLIRNKDEKVPVHEQEKLLRERARERNQYWDFALKDEVRRLANRIAEACLEEEKKGNARNGAGNNAVGVPEEEFQVFIKGNHLLGQVLQYGMAYLAFEIIRDYSQGGQHWCLIRLSGPVILEHRLTLYEGGFIEWSGERLARAIEEKTPS